MADIYFWRQWLILCAGLLYSLSVGFALAYPSVLNLAITSFNSTDIRTTSDHASWIAAINGIGGIVGAFTLSPIMQIFGRKVAQYTMDLLLCIGWLIIPFAKDIVVLYSARFIQGISVGNIYINSIILSEYVHPCRRGYFITLKKIAIALGILCCHAMSAFLTWRQIAIFAAIPPFLAVILVFFWPESPSHLALKGKFEDCETSFEWLNGNSEESRKHLKSLVEARKNNNERKTRMKNSIKETMKKILTIDFQKAFLISSLLTLSLELCGRYYVVAYAIQIMMELLENQASALYFSLAADLFILIALFLSVVLIKHANRRTILFSTGTMSVVLMFLISTMSYLKTVYTFSKHFLWFIALVLIFQCFIVNLGLVPVAFTLVGEIFNLEHKGLGVTASSLVFGILYALIIKITPVLMEKTGLHGSYAIFAVALAACLMILYKIVPETKDKTLQEIEDELSTGLRKDMTANERENLVNLVVHAK